eukprot:7385505-Prymnesium_polylepis.1
MGCVAIVSIQRGGASRSEACACSMARARSTTCSSLTIALPPCSSGATNTTACHRPASRTALRSAALTVVDCNDDRLPALPTRSSSTAVEAVKVPSAARDHSIS